ncbi:MAG: DUF5658 family protein [Thermofilum sp.]
MVSAESLYVFTLLNLVDIMTTVEALRRGGYEANPIARWFIHTMGLPGMFFLKYLAMAMIILLGHFSGNLEESIWVNNAILGGVATWNSVQILKLKKGGGGG